MKKVLFIFALVFSIAASKAQSNLTLVISDKVEKGYFKQESFKWNVQGLSGITDANNFLTNLKKDGNIKTASIAPSASNASEYTLTFSVNKISGKKYFERVMYHNGVKFAVVNGKTETLPGPTVSGAAGQ